MAGRHESGGMFAEHPAGWDAPGNHRRQRMAKGQKKSNKEIRKPKQAKAKPAEPVSAKKK